MKGVIMEYFEQKLPNHLRADSYVFFVDGAIPSLQEPWTAPSKLVMPSPVWGSEEGRGPSEEVDGGIVHVRSLWEKGNNVVMRQIISEGVHAARYMWGCDG